MTSKDELILEAATKLFMKFGKKVTIDEIAQAAGIAKGTVYLYYKNKDEILHAIVLRMGEEVMRAFRKAMRAENTARGKLRSILQVGYSSVRELQERFGIPPTEIHEHIVNPASLRAQNALHEKVCSIYQDVIEFGQETGEFVVQDASKTATVLMSVLEGLNMVWLLHGRELPNETKIDLMLDFVLHGLRYQGPQR